MLSTASLYALTVKLSNYVFITQDDLYFKTYLSSIKYAAITTALCLCVGYPFAYFMARAQASVQPALLMMVMLPFWTSFLLRVYAWKGLLTEGGWVASVLDALRVDHLLMWLGVIPGPGQYMNTPFSLVLGMVYTYLPFMVLPLYGNLAKMDLRLLEAAADLGAVYLGGVAFATLDIQVITAPTVRLDLPGDQDRLRETVALLRPTLLVLDPFVRLHRIDENAADLAVLGSIEKENRVLPNDRAHQVIGFSRLQNRGIGREDFFHDMRIAHQHES